MVQLICHYLCGATSHKILLFYVINCHISNRFQVEHISKLYVKKKKLRATKRSETKQTKKTPTPFPTHKKKSAVQLLQLVEVM